MWLSYTGQQSDRGETFNGAGFGAAVVVYPTLLPGQTVLSIGGSTPCASSTRASVLPKRTEVPDPILPQLETRQTSGDTEDNSTSPEADDVNSLEPVFDAVAVAQESSFVVVDTMNSTTTNDTLETGSYELPSLGETLAVTEEIVANQGTVVAGEDTDGTVWIPLYDTTKSVQLIAGDDGNLYLSGYSETASPPAAGFLSASGSGMVSGDLQDHAFVYYPQEIHTYNVSRIRLVEDPYIPTGSLLLTLTPLDINGRGIYAAIDTLGNSFQLVWCNIAPASRDQTLSAKVFLVKDPDAATVILTTPVLKFTITAGVTESCNPLMLISEAEGFDTGPPPP